MALWLLSWALAGDLSFSGRVTALHRDRLSDGYFVKIQGMSLQLKSPPGDIYQCLRQALNSQDVVIFSFNADTQKIGECRFTSLQSNAAGPQ